MKSVIILLVVLALTGCMNNKHDRWYQRIRDSLNNMDFPPRQLDTLPFHKYGKDFTLDTVYPNGIHEIREMYYQGRYASYIHHKDSFILHVIEYDAKDAKLVNWSQEFINGGGIGGYLVHYNKKGRVEYFFDLECERENYLHPIYSLQQLAEKLREENIDVHNVKLYYSNESILEYTTSSYPGWAWYVEMKDEDTNDPSYDVTGRLYSGQTGELLELYRGKSPEGLPW